MFFLRQLDARPGNNGGDSRRTATGGHGRTTFVASLYSELMGDVPHPRPAVLLFVKRRTVTALFH